MSSQMVSPPREEDFNNELEEGEEKMDMSLDEIIKLNRDTMMQSPVHNNSTVSSRRAERSPPPPRRDARESIRRSAASRSAAIRQGKIPDRKDSLCRPYAPPLGGRGFNTRNRDDNMFKRTGLPRRHLAPGDKVNVYEGAAGKLKISVINENSKPPPPRGPPPPSSRGRLDWGNDHDHRYKFRDDMEDDFDYDQAPPPMHVQMRLSSPKRDDYAASVPKRHRTLDSLFASIKEQREFGRVSSSSFGSGRFRAQSFRRRG